VRGASLSVDDRAWALTMPSTMLPAYRRYFARYAASTRSFTAPSASCAVSILLRSSLVHVIVFTLCHRSASSRGPCERGIDRPSQQCRSCRTVVVMRFRKLGSSDLEVSEISLGSWLTFSGGVEFEQTRACTDAAFEAGINFFDTANVYGQGAAESAWGEILSARPRGSPPDSRAAHSEMGTSMGLVMNDATLEAVDRLRPIAAEAGLSMAELALAWVLRRSELASAIVGASRPEQVHANAKASGIELSPDTLAAIDEALGDAPVTETTLAPAARSGVTRR
jgi:hypothetical protein